MSKPKPTEATDETQGAQTLRYQSWVQTPTGDRFYLGKFPTALEAQNAVDAYVHKMTGHVCDEHCGHWTAKAEGR